MGGADPGRARRIADRYLLLESLGSGGMATVHRAWDLRLEVMRAVKLLDPRLGKLARVRERFRTEAKVMARLSHPNIVTLFEDGEDGDDVWLVMEFLPGGNVWDRVRRGGALPPRLACRVMSGVLAALESAHESGIVHRDVKPQNVLLDAGGVPKVGDFGIARIDMSQQTRTGAVLGTIAYMPPEQKTSARKVDRRSDVYSAGAMFYALLTRQEPFDLYAAGMDETLGVEFYANVVPALIPVVQRATAFRPEDRYQTAAEMAAAIALAEAKLADDPVVPPLVDAERVARAKDSQPPPEAQYSDASTPVVAPQREPPPEVITADRDPPERAAETPVIPDEVVKPPALVRPAEAPTMLMPKPQRARPSFDGRPSAVPPAIDLPPAFAPPPPPRRGWLGFGCTVLAIATLAFGGVSLIVAGAAVMGLREGWRAPVPPPVAVEVPDPTLVPEPVEPAPVAEPAPVEEPRPEPDGPRAPAPAKPDPVKVIETVPVPVAPGPTPEPPTPAPVPLSAPKKHGWSVTAGPGAFSASLAADTDLDGGGGFRGRPILRLGCKEARPYAVLDPAIGVGITWVGTAATLAATVTWAGGRAETVNLTLDADGRAAIFPGARWVTQLPSATWVSVRFARSDGTMVTARFTNEGGAAMLEQYRATCGG